MMEIYDIATSLLDRDGSYRDINFEAPTWAGIGELLTLLETTFGEVSGTDQEGRSLAPPFRKSVLSATQNRGHAHLLFKLGAGPIMNLQAFVCSAEDGSPFVELTFFPEDVRQTPSLRSEFIAWADNLKSRLRARRYYARYENASWRFGDIGANSGVFLVSDDVV